MPGTVLSAVCLSSGSALTSPVTSVPEDLVLLYFSDVTFFPDGRFVGYHASDKSEQPFPSSIYSFHVSAAFCDSHNALSTSIKNTDVKISNKNIS